MSFKKILVCALTAVIFVMAFTGCGAKYKDGVYYAEDKEFGSSGWKDCVTVTVEDGDIIEVSWDAISNNPDIPINKKQYSKSGLYGMLNAHAIDEWCDQAKFVENYVLENGGVEGISTTADGYADNLTGCTMHVSAFMELYENCVNQAKK